MLKRLATLGVLVVALATAGCSSCGSCGSSSSGSLLHCESPCYFKSFHRDARQMMDFVDVYFLNYDKHDPYRCDPCIGD